MRAEPITNRQFQRSAEDWRVLAGSGAVAWFGAPSHRAGAALARWIADRSSNGGPRPDVDVRGSGVRVTIDDTGGLTSADRTLAQAISTTARELGLAADPSVPQGLAWTIDTMNLPTVLPFWQTLLGYRDSADGELRDPLRRDPRVRFRSAPPSLLRDRVHFDVSVTRDEALRRAATVTEAYAAGGEYRPDEWQVLLTDAEGNEVDLVPAGTVDEAQAADWRLPFGGMVFYRSGDPVVVAELADRVATVADETGLPLMIDIRAEGVMIDTGKDQWEDARFGDTARRVQAVARDLGLTPDPTRLRFLQVCIDAVDVVAVREFWRTVLGYRNDDRDGVTDIYDPRRLNRPMIFQRLDPVDVGRREQRNRIRLELQLPDDQVAARIEAALAAGGRITGEGGATIVDPEGNEVDIVSVAVDPVISDAPRRS